MNLDEVRVKINDINDQMLALFKERMELSKDVAAAKKEMNKAIYDAKRERDTWVVTTFNGEQRVLFL
jgi:chorismate mutase / prephenate dehydratase